ncbi:MAG: hypothetical protein IKV48_04425 [Eggerthellaceae bacterium]|nr:hypothetical protein [Eggerthellaceae bacterium]
MKKSIKSIVAAAVATAALVALVGCGGGASDAGPKVAVPSDPTNEGRALLLLQDQGLIKLADGVGLTATANDIVENPNNLEIVEMEAAAIPAAIADVDFAIINGNYAIGAGIDTATSLANEDPAGDAAQIYANIIAVAAGQETSAKTQALVAALSTQKVADYIAQTYNGAVVPAFSTSGDIPAATGDDTTIVVGASPAPHAEILALIADDLAAAGWTLKIMEFSDYIQPNVALTEGELDANYFQHISYLNDYNAENNTDIVSAALIHFEPLGLYPGKTASLEGLTTL